MLIFTILLIFTVLMTWLSKIRRFRCFHETGVATVFGIIVGAIIKYIRFHGSYNNSITVENCNNLTVAPEVLKVNINGTFYSYSFKGIMRQSRARERTRSTLDLQPRNLLPRPLTTDYIFRRLQHKETLFFSKLGGDLNVRLYGHHHLNFLYRHNGVWIQCLHGYPRVV